MNTWRLFSFFMKTVISGCLWAIIMHTHRLEINREFALALVEEGGFWRIPRKRRTTAYLLFSLASADAPLGIFLLTS
jgi:hypothetical protein